MGNKIISHKETHQHPIVYYLLNIVRKRKRVFNRDKLLFQVFFEQRQVEEVEIGLFGTCYALGVPPEFYLRTIIYIKYDGKETLDFWTNYIVKVAENL